MILPRVPDTHRRGWSLSSWSPAWEAEALVSALGQFPCFASDGWLVPNPAVALAGELHSLGSSGPPLGSPLPALERLGLRAEFEIPRAITAIRTPRSWQLPLTSLLASGRLANGDQATLRPIGLAGASC
jgi:hypothetical protein